METILKADIFFFVTTIAVVLVSAVFMVAIVYIVRILRDVRYIVGIARRETDQLAADITAARERIRREGFAGLGLMSMLANLFKKKSKRSRSKN